MWIDTHCHLDFDPLNNNIECELKLCYENKVNSIIVPSIKPDNINKVIEISKIHRNCFYALGFHPMNIHTKLFSHIYRA